MIYVLKVIFFCLLGQIHRRGGVGQRLRGMSLKKFFLVYLSILYSYSCEPITSLRTKKLNMYILCIYTFEMLLEVSLKYFRLYRIL